MFGIKNWNDFAEIDPWNPQNFVEGKISRNMNTYYGALMIEKINGKELPFTQLIYCTPKMHYPFDENNRWVAPKVQLIERYTKLDGTNIFAFMYNDSVGNKFVSYKTRLRPFLSDSKFGPFTDMWNEIMSSPGFDKLDNLIKDSGINLSFELYGSRNVHLIKYPVSLAASLLFGRKNKQVIPPSHLPKDITDTLSNVAMIQSLDGQSEYTKQYKDIQVELEANLSQDDNPDVYFGDEGEVWYLLDLQDNWSQFKLKPHLIEQIHWANSGINKNMIIAACYKAIENFNEPTRENVIQVLSEDNTELEIDKVYYGIGKYLKETQVDMQLRRSVISEYQTLGMNIITNKKDVMRTMSTKFKKDEMKRVFSIIMDSVV